MTNTTTPLNVPRRFFTVAGVCASLIIIGFGSFAFAAVLERELEVGMTGSDVTALQVFLAADPSLYPQGLVTGYFGMLTKAAVANFQVQNGIPSVGRVGPMTLPVLNALLGGSANNGSAPTISSVSLSVGTSTARVNWNTNESAKGIVYYDTAPLSIFESGNTVSVTGTQAISDTGLRLSQSILIANLQPNTTYFYVVHSTGATGYTNITWPATFTTGK